MFIINTSFKTEILFYPNLQSGCCFSWVFLLQLATYFFYAFSRCHQQCGRVRFQGDGCQRKAFLGPDLQSQHLGNWGMWAETSSCPNSSVENAVTLKTNTQNNMLKYIVVILQWSLAHMMFHFRQLAVWNVGITLLFLQGSILRCL